MIIYINMIIKKKKEKKSAGVVPIYLSNLLSLSQTPCQNLLQGLWFKF